MILTIKAGLWFKSTEYIVIVVQFWKIYMSKMRNHNMTLLCNHHINILLLIWFKNIAKEPVNLQM